MTILTCIKCGGEGSLCSVQGCQRRRGRTKGLCEAHYRRLLQHGDVFGGRTFTGTPLSFLNETVIGFADKASCLIWPFARTQSGYGRVFFDGKTRRVHRVVCKIVHGPAPTPEHQAAHSCGKGCSGCVNPHHVSWKTPKENAADRFEHGAYFFGERNRNAKLTKEKVAQIRALKGVRQEVIAGMFGISRSNVGQILCGDTWREREKQP